METNALSRTGSPMGRGGRRRDRALRLYELNGNLAAAAAIGSA
nr:hypothetical protein [Ensifer sp. IC4062]